MTEAEIIEKINKKRTELDEKKAQSANSDVIKAIESEIEDLVSSLPSIEKTREKQIFLDECAG